MSDGRPRYRGQSGNGGGGRASGPNRGAVFPDCHAGPGQFSRLLSGRTEDRGIIFPGNIQDKALPVVSRKS